jgi:hypothetical protein
LLRFLPLIRQKGFDLMGGVVADAGQHVAEVGKRIKLMSPGGYAFGEPTFLFFRWLVEWL